MSPRIPDSRWLLTFWAGQVIFWLLFLSAAGSIGELGLRAAMLGLAWGLYLAVRGDRHAGDQVPELVPWFVGATALLALGGIAYYDTPVERSASAVFALSLGALFIHLQRPTPSP